MHKGTIKSAKDKKKMIKNTLFLLNLPKVYFLRDFLTFRKVLIISYFQKSYKNDIKKNKKNDTSY